MDAKQYKEIDERLAHLEKESSKLFKMQVNMGQLIQIASIIGFLSLWKGTVDASLLALKDDMVEMKGQVHGLVMDVAKIQGRNDFQDGRIRPQGKRPVEPEN